MVLLLIGKWLVPSVEAAKFVVSEEDKKEKAVAALEKVEADKNRDSYNAASTLISALAVKNTNLTYRLKKVDKVISVEETRIAAEKAKEAEEAQKAQKAEEAQAAGYRAPKRQTLKGAYGTNENRNEKTEYKKID